MQYVDYDGTKFGTQRINLQIRAYSGTRPITALSCSPIEFHVNKTDIQDKLMDRASRIEAFAGVHYRTYEGLGWRMSSLGQKEKYSVKGRIVVDTYGWNKFNPNHTIYVSSLPKEHSPHDDETVQNNANADEEYDDDNDMDGGMPVDGHFGDEDDQTVRQALTPDQKLVCTHLLRGYALKEKIWLNLYVSH